MRCEVCGRKIHSDPIRAIIEGARLTVCAECSKHGKVILPQEEAEIERKKATAATSIAPKRTAVPVSMVQKKSSVPQVAITTEVVEDYQTKIRAAREKLGLSHEDLGKKINEKASVLRHIETGKMAPNNLLASKLERTLKITLMVPIEKEKEKAPPVLTKPANEELTLGDLIQFNSKGEEPSKRKQS
ncbi:MAG: multiprotein bridging factor aMBF1 [Candidatus Bathyarchaeota archaeon]|nr:multiprotein bridging factor aMBF1 [Candidatus Bathyarchaeota archaeon]